MLVNIESMRAPWLVFGFELLIKNSHQANEFGSTVNFELGNGRC